MKLEKFEMKTDQFISDQVSVSTDQIRFSLITIILNFDRLKLGIIELENRKLKKNVQWL